MSNWNHGGDVTGRFRGGKTASERKDAQERHARQQERGAYTRWCSDSQSAAATLATAVMKFPWGACNGKRTRRLRRRA